MLDVKKYKKIKYDASERIESIEARIRAANKIYNEYISNKDSQTLQGFNKLKQAVDYFYKDEYVMKVVGGGMFSDTLPMSMYDSMQNHKYEYCRRAIKNMDKKLAKEGIYTNQILDFVKKEQQKFNDSAKTL